MKKGILRIAAVLAIVLVVYNLVAFLIPFAKTVTFWISYGAGLAAIAVAAVFGGTALARHSSDKTCVFAFPVVRISLIYMVAQLALGLVGMALGCWIPWWAALLVYAIGCAVALIGLMGANTAAEIIQEQDRKLKQEVLLMRSLQSRMAQLATVSGNSEVVALAEEFRYSDPMSDPILGASEAALVAAVNELQQALEAGADVSAVCRKVSIALAERNRLCKLYK